MGAGGTIGGMAIGAVVFFLLAFAYAVKFFFWRDEQRADAALTTGVKREHEHLRRVGIDALRSANPSTDAETVAFSAINQAADEDMDGETMDVIAAEAVAEWRGLTSPSATR
jgi:hypothetical protein